MGATWKHPKLGACKYNSLTGAWMKTVEAPGFKAFKYGEPSGSCELAFEANDEDDVPSENAAKLAAKVLAKHSELVPKITKALWNDFNGRGPDSGMWWHGDLDQVAEAMKFDDLPGPTKADDLRAVMAVSQILVRKNADGYDQPIVELVFDAAFEQEHGVGVLTDGKAILGTGYQMDVAPYEVE